MNRLATRSVTPPVTPPPQTPPPVPVSTVPVSAVPVTPVPASTAPPALLTERMRPTCVGEVVGHSAQKGALLNYVRRFGGGAEEPPLMAVVWGPAGIGKTSLVHAVCADFHVREINASDVRSGALIKQEVVKHLPFRHLTSGKRYAVVLDEADGVDEESLTAQALVDCVKDLPARGPLFVVGNSKRSLLLRSLCARRNVLEVRMGALSSGEVSAVCAKAGVRVPEAVRQGGDARAALNSAFGSGVKVVQRNAFQVAEQLLCQRVGPVAPVVQSLVLNDPTFCLKIMHDNADRAPSMADFSEMCSDVDMMGKLYKAELTGSVMAQWGRAREQCRGNPGVRGRHEMRVSRGEGVSAFKGSLKLGALERELMLGWGYDQCVQWLQQHSGVTLEDLKQLGRRLGQKAHPLTPAWVRAYNDTCSIDTVNI